MGCWNGTCGLTNLPIMHGDAIYVFPIVDARDDSFCYSSALWKPVVTPFVAEYNDYGSGENCSGNALGLIIDGFKNKLIEKEVGSNQYHDIPVTKADFDIDMFFEACRERRLSVGHSTPIEANFCMVRKDVVDRLWSEFKFDRYTGKGEGMDPTNAYDRDISYQLLATYIPSLLDTVFSEKLNDEDEAEFADMKDTTPEAIQNSRKMIIDMRRRINGLALDYDNDHPLKDTFRNYGSGHSYDAFDLTKTVTALIESGKRDEAIALMETAMIGKCVEHAMTCQRKVWLPSMHQGSQGQEFEMYRFMNKVTADIMDAHDLEYGYEDE